MYIFLKVTFAPFIIQLMTSVVWEAGWQMPGTEAQMAPGGHLVKSK